jgi:hypothetical protein
MIDYPIKTWLTCESNDIIRHCEYEDGYKPDPDWIGTIERSEEDGDRWFKMYGDNRTLSVAELQQILDFL